MQNNSKGKERTILAVFLATILSLGVGSTAIPTTQSQLLAQEDNGNGDNDNGDGDESSSPVQVTVQREGAETEDINVTPNVTVVVDFEQTQVTNETVTIGEPPASTNGGNASQGNATAEQPPQNATVTPPPANETGTGTE